MTDDVTDHVIIRFYIITIAYFLVASSNECVGISDHGLVEKSS